MATKFTADRGYRLDQYDRAFIKQFGLPAYKAHLAVAKYRATYVLFEMGMLPRKSVTATEPEAKAGAEFLRSDR